MEHLPPWLRNLPLPPRPASPDVPTAGVADTDTPDWLRELQSEIASEPPPATDDDWLASLRDSAAPPAQEPAADDADWLTGLRASAEPPAEQPAADNDMDWLTGLQSSAEPPAEQAPAAAESGQESTTNSRIKMPVGATDWLRSIGQDPDAKSEPLSEAISVPLDESGVPDWLRDLSPEEVSRGVEAEVPESQSRFDPQASDWLTDDVPVPDASTVSADPVDQRQTGGETADSGEVPDWLRDVIAAEGGEPAPLDASTAGQWDGDESSSLVGGAEVPAWLRDIGERSPGAAEPPAPGGPAWLQGEDEQPEAPREAPAGANAVPSWLQESGQSSPPARPEPLTPEDEVPAWLREAEQGDSDAPSAPVSPAPAEDEVPAWLREVEQSAPASPAPAEDEVPAWLREAEQGGAPLPPAPVPVEDEVPSWLREAEQSADLPAADASPTWLRDALAERGVEAPQATPPDDDVPAWLTDDSQPQAASAPPQRPSADLPPWLASDSSTPSGTQATPAQAGDLALPSWLRGVADEAPPTPAPRRDQPPASPPQRPAAEQGDTSSGFMRGAELPSWLRVPEPEIPAESAEGQQLDWLRNLGGPEPDDESDNVAQLAAVDRPQRSLYRRSAEQLEAIALLKGLSRAPYPAPVAAPAPVPRTGLQRIGLHRVLYALLALALLVGLLLPQITGPFQTPAPTAIGATELGAVLDSLDSEDVVLVAYEWAAQRSAELRPLEQAAFNRLTAEKTKLVLVSTDMQGTMLSFDLREPLRAAGYNVEPDGREFGGRDYVLLGYRPGGELALRSLAQDLRGELTSDFTGQDASQGLVANNPDGTPRISSISDMALILVMADQPQDVQVWMEQVHRVAPTVPIAFLLPQEAEPLAQPYLRLPGVYHVAGQQGALALMAGDGVSDPTAVARISGQHWYAVLVFVILMLLGGLGAALARGGARRSRGGAA
jgi:hypothetical protein